MKSNPDILRELSTEYVIIGETLEGEDNSKMMGVVHALNAGAEGIESNASALDTLTKVRETLDRLEREHNNPGAPAFHPEDPYVSGYLAGIDIARAWLNKALGDDL